MKKRIVVVCPGRGSYTKDTLNYLAKYPKKLATKFLPHLDSMRAEIGEPSISSLDSAEKFQVSLHTKGEHASPLIYACAYVDFLAINREKYDIVAICGNSMGWYLTLAFGEALDESGAFHLIQTMGSMMKDKIIGGQIIYPTFDAYWKLDINLQQKCMNLIDEVNQGGIGEAFVSIYLGGYLIIGGDAPGLKHLLNNLPKSGDYPFQLINHAAFHTPMLKETSVQAMSLISPRIFHAPNIPLVDGRGKIWKPYSTDTSELYDYTLGHQVYAPYDFTDSVSVALKEFAPDHLVLLGPGNSLGGALGQILIHNNWSGIQSKSDFQERQKTSPIVLSMGLVEQREVLL